MAKEGLVLCDTNILIGLFRKDASIKAALDRIGDGNIAISVITKAELLAGTTKVNYAHTLKVLEMFELVHFDTEGSLVFSRLVSNKKVFNTVNQKYQIC